MGVQSRKSCLTSGEWLTLLGTVLAVLSPSFTWKHDPPKTTGLIGAVYVKQYMRGEFYRNGFELHFGWIVALCGVICGSMLLFTPSQSEARLCLAVQVLLGLSIGVFAIMNIGFYAGVLLGLAACVLLIVGGVLRYGAPDSAGRGNRTQAA